MAREHFGNSATALGLAQVGGVVINMDKLSWGPPTIQGTTVVQFNVSDNAHLANSPESTMISLFTRKEYDTNSHREDYYIGLLDRTKAPNNNDIPANAIMDSEELVQLLGLPATIEHSQFNGLLGPFTKQQATTIHGMAFNKASVLHLEHELDKHRGRLVESLKQPAPSTPAPSAG